MKGLQLCRAYFESFGLPMIRKLERQYPDLKGQFAAGLAGQGSECLGFDDGLSADHDFGPSFCLWLPQELYREYGRVCQEAYERLPKEFSGYPARQTTAFGQNRVGVLEIGDFYYRLIGREDAPKSNAEWMWIAESRLSQAVSGEVFLDEAGQFSAVREQLLSFYPEDVRKKKIAARAAAMAQSGQYNYGRLCRRGEWTGALLSLQEFVKNACSMVHLLNKRYTPFYKWMHRSLADLPVLPEVYGLLDQLTDDCDSRNAWRTAKEEDFLLGIINTKDARAVLIETICQLVIRELKNQGLSDAEDLYLETHALHIMGKIQDPAIASLQLLEG
ncbi:MAG: DUF4037 domain-containing protein [Eubacteriales bacterium]|nr:DUF4037 domain-containing protein [Eubacteriales bacterium]